MNGRWRYLTEAEVTEFTAHVDRVKKDKEWEMIHGAPRVRPPGLPSPERPRMEIYSMGRWWAVRGGRDR